MALARRRTLGGTLVRGLPLAGTILGVGLGAWLVATNELGAIGAAFGRVGWPGLAAVVIVRMTIVALCGIAWARILDRLEPRPITLDRATSPGPRFVARSDDEPDAAPSERALAEPGIGAFVLLRFVREGINVLLPVASVGGEVVGGRLLTFWGVTGAMAAASLLADMLIQVATQVAFTLTGTALLRQLDGEAAASLAGWTLSATAVAVLVIAGFFAVQRMGPIRSIERALAAFGRRFVREAQPQRNAGPESEQGVQGALDAVWSRGRYGHLAQAFLLHFAAWGLGAAEIGIALTCIGIEFSLSEVIVLEALSQAIKSAAFMVPSGLGVQEGGFVVVGALFGLDAETAIALSLVKRVPDVVLGLPSLIVWQMLEARRAAIRPTRG